MIAEEKATAAKAAAEKIYAEAQVQWIALCEQALQDATRSADQAEQDAAGAEPSADRYYDSNAQVRKDAQSARESADFCRECLAAARKSPEDAAVATQRAIESAGWAARHAADAHEHVQRNRYELIRNTTWSAEEDYEAALEQTAEYCARREEAKRRVADAEKVAWTAATEADNASDRAKKAHRIAKTVWTRDEAKKAKEAKEEAVKELQLIRDGWPITEKIKAEEAAEHAEWAESAAARAKSAAEKAKSAAVEAERLAGAENE